MPVILITIDGDSLIARLAVSVPAIDVVAGGLARDQKAALIRSVPNDEVCSVQVVPLLDVASLPEAPVITNSPRVGDHAEALMESAVPNSEVF